MKPTKKIVFAALFIAIGVVLPLCFHMVPSGGNIFLPMHLPVIIGGMLIGPYYGLLVGFLTPTISHLLTAMPPSVVYPGMTLELMSYAFFSGLLIRIIKTNYKTLNVYLALIPTMLMGRIISGVTNATIFQAGKYSFEAWITASFITAIPGIVIQLIVIPVVYIFSEKMLRKEALKNDL